MIDPDSICMRCMSELPSPKCVCPHCGFDNASAHNEAHQLECGSILAGTYLIGRVLGQGGFGITYIGWDLNLDIKVAIKEYYPEGCVTRDTHTHVSVLTYAGEKETYFQKGKERFVNEAKTLAKFSGDGCVVGVRAFFYENGTAYIVMDFVEGETLKSYVARRGGKLPSAEVLELFKPLFRSLARVHEMGLLHRDISPDNIMLRPDGTLALLDFGAARQMSVAGEHSNTINVKHGFAPEEQYRTRGEQGPWTDVYALCATIYRLTTGVTPPQALDRMANAAVLTPPNQLGADFTPAQEQAVVHGLAVFAADRTQDIRQLTQELGGGMLATPGTIGRRAVSSSGRSAAQNLERPFAPASGMKKETAAEQNRSSRSSGSAAAQQRKPEKAEPPAKPAGRRKKAALVAGIAAAAVLLVTLLVILLAKTDRSEPVYLTNTPNYGSSSADGSDQSAADTSGSVGTATPMSTADEYDPDEVIEWQDPILESGIRQALGMSADEPVTCGDVSGVRILTIAGETVVINDEDLWPGVDYSDRTYSTDYEAWLPFPESTISLSDLRYFSGLQQLGVYAIDITDYDALQHCALLTQITLDACGNIACDQLSVLPNLCFLSIRDCDAVDLSAVPDGSVISALSFSSCGALTGTDLVRFGSLTSLDIWSCSVDSIESLTTLPYLTELSLGYVGLRDIGFLNDLPQLTSLYLCDSDLSEITPLADMKNLQSLYLMSTSVSNDDLKAISGLTQLTLLWLDGNSISDLSFAAGLTRLQSLSLSYTNITDIGVVSGMKQLYTIYIDGTNVTDLSPLEGLPLVTIGVSASMESEARAMFPNADVYAW